jgi:Mrp family chromosome partitioning ATPase
MAASAAAGTQLVRIQANALDAGLVSARISSNSVVLPDTVHPSLALLQADGRERSVAFRALRRRLAEKNDPRAILVTSAEDEEGKTTCAANLALAIAESGRMRVLLVEANLRRPQIAKIFGFSPPQCLSIQLADHLAQPNLPWRTTEIQPTGLHVLALAPDANTEGVMHGPTFSAAIARWRLAFDYIVADGPAMLSSCDASIIQDAMDTVVVVARSGTTRNRTLRRALDQLSSEKVAGIVLMDSPG